MEMWMWKRKDRLENWRRSLTQEVGEKRNSYSIDVVRRKVKLLSHLLRHNNFIADATEGIVRRISILLDH